MDAKLTLSIRPDIIARAKEWARQEGKSLSTAVEEYLDSITHQATKKESALDIIKKLGAQMNEEAISDKEVAQRIHNQRMKH